MTPERTTHLKPLTAAQLEERKQRLEAISRLDPHVDITLRGESYTLELNNRSVKDLLADTGVNVIKDGFPEDKADDPEFLGSLLFRALQKHHPEMTQEKADDLFSPRQYFYITYKLKEVLSLYLPDMTGIDRGVEQSTEGVPSSSDPT